MKTGEISESSLWFFDAPTLNKPFKQRYEIFKKEIEDIQAENLVVLPQIECEGEKQILE
jgi:hypothetical protein